MGFSFGCGQKMVSAPVHKTSPEISQQRSNINQSNHETYDFAIAFFSPGMIYFTFEKGCLLLLLVVIVKQYYWTAVSDIENSRLF